jgi:hypothetical protein
MNIINAQQTYLRRTAYKIKEINAFGMCKKKQMEDAKFTDCISYRFDLMHITHLKIVKMVND